MTRIVFMKTTSLYEFAHARTGDKGNRSNISVLAYRPEDFSLLVEQVTEEKVAEHFAYRNPTKVTRYVWPRRWALNFVLGDGLDGGVTMALTLESNGQTLSLH